MGVKTDKHGKLLTSLKNSELEALLKSIPNKRRLLVLQEIEKRKSKSKVAFDQPTAEQMSFDLPNTFTSPEKTIDE